MKSNQNEGLRNTAKSQCAASTHTRTHWSAMLSQANINDQATSIASSLVADSSAIADQASSTGSVFTTNSAFPGKPALLVSCALVTTILAGAGLGSNVVFADDVVDEVNITVPVSCTISGTGMNTHNATINNGQLNSTIGETTMKAYCNDNNGFAIYAIGYTDDEDGKNVLANSTLGSTYDIATGTATSGDTSNWAMKLTAITSPTPTYPVIIAGSTDDTDREQGDPDYTTFQEVPDDYALVVKRKSGTDIGASAEGASFKTTYQAYISKIQPAGTYTGQVKYTLVHPHNATAPEKPLGLCQSSDACMQQQTSASMAQKLPNVGDTTTLYDARDNQAYTVAKLADGKYWMTENLNIAGGTALSSEDSDFDSSYTLPTTNGWTVNDGKLILPASAIKNENDNSLTDSTQFSRANYVYVFNGGNKENCGANGQDAPCYSYYSWDAATLGSGRSIAADNTDASYSICPKNWKLPTSGSQSDNGWKRGDFYTLATAYGANLESMYYESSSANFYNNAGPSTTPDFLLAGYYSDGSFYEIGSYGSYWSATTISSYSQYARGFTLGPAYVDSAKFDHRRAGRSVRCLFGP